MGRHRPGSNTLIRIEEQQYSFFLFVLAAKKRTGRTFFANLVRAIGRIKTLIFILGPFFGAKFFPISELLEFLRFAKLRQLTIP